MTTTTVTMTKTINGTRIEVQGSDAQRVTDVLDAACKAVRKSDIPPTEVAKAGTRTGG